MNDLRSLEGIGQLLSQKIHQTHKHRLKPRHHRTSSGPSSLILSASTPTPTSDTTSISQIFPPEIASLLTNNIQMGYYQNISSQAPILIKSHSDFVREDMLNLNDSNYSSDDEQFVEPENNEYLILELPEIDNNNNNNNDDRETSLAPPPSLAPLIGHGLSISIPSGDDIAFPIIDMKNDYDTESKEESVSTQLIQSDIDLINLINLKEEFMEYNHKQKNQCNNIGNGASGIVRKAFHYRSCKMVAIKQCRSKKKHELDAFIKESKLYKEFEDNQNIINMIRFGRDSEDHDLCIAMEYMDLGSSESLEINKRNDLSMHQKELMVGHIIFNVLLALKDIHNKLYVHNDIKPANILSNKYGEIKLSDFGTVLKLDNKYSFLTKNNGSQRYQSPEKLTKQSTKYNTKSDIWSVGITCFELLFGERSDDNLLSYITNKPILTPKTHKISENCCNFISLCLRTDAKQRPSVQHLLTHKWFIENIKPIPLNERWPWLAIINKQIKNNKKNGKRTSFDLTQHQYYNEDLLFMISALIIDYSKQSVDLENANDSSYSLHRRISQFYINKTDKTDKTDKIDKIDETDENQIYYTDEERIANIAHYSYCSKDMVIERIRATVSHIKSRLNKAEITRIDS